MKMYKLVVKGTTYTCPKCSIVALALTKALDRGINNSNINDETTAIEYLESIGVKVEEE